MNKTADRLRHVASAINHVVDVVDPWLDRNAEPILVFGVLSLVVMLMAAIVLAII